jgi:hypothetical protein
MQLSERTHRKSETAVEYKLHRCHYTMDKAVRQSKTATCWKWAPAALLVGVGDVGAARLVGGSVGADQALDLLGHITVLQ